MKKILFLLCIICSICLISCDDNDPCENIVCENGGECDGDGNCICPPEFTGTNCEVLAPAKMIKISKIVVTDFLAMNGTEEWDENDGPDLVLAMTFGTVPGGDILESSEVIENCVLGNEYEFIVDWSMDGDAIGYNFSLRDFDGDPSLQLSPFMGSRPFSATEYRLDLPTTIDLPTLSGGFVGLRMEVEWIFE